MNDVPAISWKDRIFPPRNDLPLDLTTIDIMKTVAITLMIIDHVGWLLFPQFEMFRVLGRLCVPLWFFLIGFASARDIPTRWLVAGIILMISNLVVGLPPLALSILFTMALIRLVIDPFWRFAAGHPVYFWWMVLLLIFAAYVSDMVVEYGTMGFLLACAGYAVRNREDVDEALGRGVPQSLMIVALVAFGIMSGVKFGFSIFGVSVLAAGLLGVYFVLQTFRIKTLEGTAAKSYAPLVRFMGRNTLEIYVIHLLLLKAVYGLKLLASSLIG